MKIVLLVLLLAGGYVLIYSGWTDKSILDTINIASSSKKGKGK